LLAQPLLDSSAAGECMNQQNDEKQKNATSDIRRIVLYFVFTLAFVSFLSQSVFFGASVNRVAYSEFLKMVDEGKISEATISDSRIVAKLKESPASPNATKTASATEIFTVPVHDEGLVPRLQKAGVIFSASPPSMMGSMLAWILPALIFYGIWMLLMRKASGMAKGGVFGLTKSKAKIFMEKDVKTTFADAAGVDEAKEELKEIASFLKDPTKYTQIGGRAPKGVLLVGPPGTGKTLLARALAGEAKVPFFSINGSEFVEMFVGLGAARVRELFQDARSHAPCIVFIDEIDALGQARALGSLATGANDEKEQTLHQLLAEMDGFDSSEGVILIGATNRPQILDPALLRAGRFDRQVLVSYPDQTGRHQILQVHAKKIKLDQSVNLEKVAALTAGFSGADLANIVNEAALFAIRRGAEIVGQGDFTMAIERVVAGLEHKKRLMNPEEKRRVAYHEMGHATVLLNSHLADKVHKISIIPRGMGSLGYTIQRPVEDRYLVDAQELLEKIAVLLGGRASEKIFFGTLSTGAADDLVKATDIARSMVTQYAMTEALGCATFEQKRSSFLATDLQAPNTTHFSEETAREIDHEIKHILDEAFEIAVKSIEDNRAFVEESAHSLLETETLDENQIAELWSRHHQGRPVSRPYQEISV
jgi:cell division protease FtsH